MDLVQFCSTSRVVVVAGKGGVGKTTVSAALAVSAARAGASVLVVDVEGKSGLAACFGTTELSYEETTVAPGVRARALTPDGALLEYLESHGLRGLSRRLVRSGMIEVVATAVPGLPDLLVLGKVRQLETARAADLVVVDAPAAGHAIRFLLSAQGIFDAVRVGPVHQQAADVVEMLSDAERCQVLLVTLPEETPVNEVVDTAYALEDGVGIKLGPLVVNGCDDETGLDLDATSLARDAALAGVLIPSGEVAALTAATAFRRARASLQHDQRERLERLLPLPQICLPQLADEVGRREVDLLADALTAGVGMLPDSPPAPPDGPR